MAYPRCRPGLPKFDARGIPEDELGRVFERFFRGRAARAGGSGIGLTVVRELVTALGGDVRAANASSGRRLREIEARTRERLSFSAFLIHCLARAVTENPHLNAARSGRRLFRFNEVNVGTMVEREQQGEKTVAPLRIDSADRKSVEEIHDEIRHAQAIPIRNVGSVQGWEWVMRISSPVRRVMWRFIHSRPQMAHRYGLLVSMSAVGMFGEGGGWEIPLTPATVQLTGGGIGRRAVLEGGKVVEHEFLSLTLSFDHEIVAGAPAARFAEGLRALVESGYGLPAGGRATASSAAL